MRRETASRRWKQKVPYTESKTFTGLQDWGLAAHWASKAVDRRSWGHDADFENIKHPYTTYNPADRRWVYRNRNDPSWTARVGTWVFNAKKALLPHSRRTWDTVRYVERTPNKPQSLRAPTVTHRTTNLVQKTMPGYKRPRLLQSRMLASAYRRQGPVRARWGRSRNQRRQATFKHLMNCIETKYKDLNAAVNQAQPSGAPRDILDGIIGGDDANSERIGNKIFIRSLNINGQVTASADLGALHCQEVRIMIVQDKMALGTSPVAADLLDLATITAPTRAYRQLDKAMRFNVLMDKKIMVDKIVANETQGKACKKFTFNKKWPNGLHVRFDSSAGLTTNIQRNNIWVFVLADRTTAVENPMVAYSARVRYTD